MDKFVEILIKENPYYEITCENPKCKKKTKIKTKDLFSSANNKYVFDCPFCNEQSILTDIDEWVSKQKATFKTLGIKW